MQEIFIILAITILGPVLGSLVGVIRRPSRRFMYNMLAFAGGVMLAVSFLELIPESINLSSVWICGIGILAGSLVMFSLDKLIPHIHLELCSQEQGCRLRRTALYLLIGIFLHNFPEGMAIALGSVTEIKLSIIIALAIAIHDIPEGICTSAPYFHCTGKRMKSFLLSSSTAIPTIAGFFLAGALFSIITPAMVGLIAGATAGLMIYITCDELIPTSCNSKSHETMFSLIFGVLFVIMLGLL